MREWLNRNPGLAAAAAGGLLVVSIAILLLTGGGSGASSMVYYYDEAEGRVFAAEAAGPATGDGVYRAHVFGCGGCDGQTHVGYVLHPDDPNRARLPGEQRWVDLRAAASDYIFERMQERCAGEGTPRECYP